MFRTILVASDGSEDAKRALSVAADLASKYGARLIVAHALMRDADFDILRKLADRHALPEALRDEFDRHATRKSAPTATSGPSSGSTVLPSLGLIEAVGHQVLDRAHAAAKKAGAKKVAAVLLVGDAADAILDYAKRKKVDLIVLGTLGFGDFRSVVLGTVSHKIGSRAHCSCLTVR